MYNSIPQTYAHGLGKKRCILGDQPAYARTVPFVLDTQSHVKSAPCCNRANVYCAILFVAQSDYMSSLRSR